MHVLMRIKMRWLSSGQFEERLCLPLDFPLDRGPLMQVNNAIYLDPRVAAISPFAQIKMQPKAQASAIVGRDSRFVRRRLADHKTGAGHNAALMRFDDASIDTLGVAEVVGVNDQV